MKFTGLCILIVYGLFASISYAYDWSTNPGNGTPANPYQISTPDQLIAIGSNANLLDKSFILLNDITFDPNNNSAHLFTSAVIAPEGIHWFTGSFNGNGYTIFNFKINGGYKLGLFGQVREGSISSVRLEDVEVTSGSASGGLCGFNDSGNIANCFVSGAVAGESSIGLICGYNDSGNLANCVAEGTVTGWDDYSSSYGIICGWNSYGTILNCSASGSVYGYERVGGLCGLNYLGSINNCFANSYVVGMEDSSSLGGLCGMNNNGIIKNCYALGDVTGDVSSSYLGGFCGSMGGSAAKIINCYSIGTVTGHRYNGGFLGSLSSGLILDCFWDTQTSETNIGIGSGFSIEVIGKTTVQMKQKITFIGSGWDFLAESNNGIKDFWRMCVDGMAYPKLSWKFGANGDFACPDGVELEDLETLALHWLLVEEGNPNFSYAVDGSGDGRIDQAEIDILSKHWQE